MIDPSNPDYENTPASDSRPVYHYLPQGKGTPFVSIITPYFNTGPEFCQTARCIQRMSYPHWEWIIVDDGTTREESLTQLRTVATTDERIRVIAQANRGPSVARNRAVADARGRYLLQLDADDMVEPTFVEKSIWVMETQRQFAACTAHNVTFGVRPLLWDHGFQDYGRNLTLENFMTSQAMIRRDAYLEAGGYDESIVRGHEDWDFWLNLADRGLWGYTIPEYLTWYRNSHSSRSLETSGDSTAQKAFHAWLLNKHDRLRTQFPQPKFITGEYTPHAMIQDQIPVRNPLAKPEGTKRILFLVPWLTIGGADKFNLDMVRTLSRRGYEFTVVATCDSHNPWLHQFAQITPDIFLLPTFLSNADYPRFLNYLVASRQIDAVLISNSELGYSLVPFLRAHHPNLPILDYTHVEEEQWKNGGYPWMAVRLGSQLDLNVTSTHHLKDWMVDRGADPERVAVVHTNIDPVEWDSSLHDINAIRRRLGVNQDTAVILYVGRVVDQKRPLLWVEILHSLMRTEIDVLGLVIGDGDRLDAMKSHVHRYKLQKRIRFLGALPNKDVRDLMAAADILLLPSKYEGLALVLYEALAMRTVPVATAFGGHPELVTPACGYLISSSAQTEIEEYAAAVRQLVRDRGRLMSMSAAGRERVQQHFALEHMADGLELAIARASKVAAARSAKGIDLQLARYIAATAIEEQRLNQLSDRLWYELSSKSTLPRVGTVGDVARVVRANILPIGTRRYEVYKKVRRTLVPHGRYLDEVELPIQGAASEVDATSLSRGSSLHMLTEVATIVNDASTENTVAPLDGEAVISERGNTAHEEMFYEGPTAG